MSRPHTLGEAAARILAGTDPSIAICEFADTFYASADREPMLADEPPLTGDRRLDALLGGIAEYLSKRYELAGIPAWCSDGCRFLGEPWHTTASDGDGMREYLTHVSPAEFASRNIFTEALPLRRASQSSHSVPLK